MKIRILRYAFLLAFLMPAFAACSRYDDELKALKERMALVEQRLDDLNNDIEALHSLVMEIKQGGYVTAVLPDEQEGKVIGYTLAFNDGRSVYLRMESSSTVEAPQIGVRQAEDGNWYWTVDGEWLLDDAGSKVLASAVSQKAVQMKFEGDSWYISYDGGSTWEQIPTKSSSGLSFSDVDTSNPDYVVITLSDGTQLRLPTWAAFDALQQQVKQLNINLSALSRIVSALQDNDYLISMTPMAEDGVPVGWLLNFSKSGLIVIYSSGNTGSPQIGVRQDTDGVYYWTLNGEWLLDSAGGKVRAEGAKGADAVPPRLKIEEQYWWISYDDGETWTQLGKATGEDGDSFFREVDQSNDEYVRLVLSDGTAIDVPRYVPLDIELSLPSEMVIGPYEDWYVPYRIVGTNKEDANLAVFGQGGLSVGISDNDTIWVGSTDGTGGSFVVLLSVPSGVTVMKSFKIESRIFIIYWGSYIFPYYNGATLNLEQAGGEVYLHCVTNASFDLDLSEVPWASLIQKTPCDGGYDIQLSVSPNGNEARAGRIFLTFEDPEWSGRKHYSYADNVSRYYITINQDGAGEGTIMPDVLEVQAGPQGKTYEIEVKSSSGALSARPDDSCSWLSCSMEKKTQDIWTLYVNVDGCPESSGRNSMVYVSEGGKDIGSMLVEQKDLHLNEEAMIKMEVLSLPENGHKVVLPFSGQLSLRVDWGDGCVTDIERGLNNKEIPFCHKYQDSEGIGHYTITASGTVQRMTSSGVEDFVTVESVLQWGADLGLTSMAGAFYKVKTLKSIAEDKYNVFSDVTSFSSAFHSCTALEIVPVNLFDAALAATDFTKAFLYVNQVTGESPYVMLGGQKVHLYERSGYKGIFSQVSNYTSCFYGGKWADQDAIHLAGWD